MNQPMSYSELYIEFATEILEVISLKIKEELNKHGIAEIYILLENKEKYEFISSLTPNTQAKIVSVSEGIQEILFFGLPVKVMIKEINTIYYAWITLKSMSFLMDCKRKKRSFQNQNDLFENLFKKIIEENHKGICFDSASNKAVQEESIIQYDETDWEFLKRIASKLKAKLVVNVREAVPVITIGRQIGNEKIQSIVNDSISQDIDSYLHSQLNYGDWKPEQKVYFKINSIYQYLLYDKILYKNIVFTIMKKGLSLENGICIFNYWLVKEEGIRQDKIVNSKIRGVSIEGKVIDVMTDRVKLHLSIDTIQSVETAFWYKCQTNYTADGSTGFYCMPQKGDSAILYFPTEYIEDGYIKTVIRKDEQMNEKTQNPNIKYWQNIHGKEIMLAPSSICITATNGVLIHMNEKQGIEITGSGTISIHGTSARITGGKVALRAGKQVRLATKKSSITIDTEIHIKASGGVSGV